MLYVSIQQTKQLELFVSYVDYVFGRASFSTSRILSRRGFGRFLKLFSFQNPIIPLVSISACLELLGEKLPKSSLQIVKNFWRRPSNAQAEEFAIIQIRDMYFWRAKMRTEYFGLQELSLIPNGYARFGLKPFVPILLTNI